MARLTIIQIGADAPTAVRRLLNISSWTLVATMLLALWWALGRAAGLPHPSIGWMVATHGLANAFGFALCGVLARRRMMANPPQISVQKKVAA